MEPVLNDLRRYAIDNRTEIKISDSNTGREVLINTRGQVRIESDDKEFRIEEMLPVADWFEITAQGKPQRLSREGMAALITEQFKQRKFAASHKDEDD